MVVGESTTNEDFETYLEQVLSPTLWPERVMVMDNLDAYKGERMQKLIKERDCELLYLPPYSPDLNSIEEVFSKVKAAVAADRGSKLHGTPRGAGHSSFGGHLSGHPRLLRALRLPAGSSTVMRGVPLNHENGAPRN